MRPGSRIPRLPSTWLPRYRKLSSNSRIISGERTYPLTLQRVGFFVRRLELGKFLFQLADAGVERPKSAEDQEGEQGGEQGGGRRITDLFSPSIGRSGPLSGVEEIDGRPPSVDFVEQHSQQGCEVSEVFRQILFRSAPNRDCRKRIEHRNRLLERLFEDR